MAQAQTRNLNTIINKFYGGMSQDDYVGGADNSGQPMCYYDGSGIEVRKNAKFITLSQNTGTEVAFGNVIDMGKAIAMIDNIDSASQIIITTKYNIIDGTGATIKTLTRFPRNMFTYGGYNHIIKSDGYIDRFTTIGSYTADYANIGSGTINTNPPYIIDSGYIYICVDNIVYKGDLTSSGYPFVKMLTLDSGYTIKGITLIGDRFYIYSTNGEHSIQYLWNGGTQTATGSIAKINWYGKPIVNVANINNIDYVVVGDEYKRALYIVNGYQLELLYQSKYFKAGKTEYPDKFVLRPDYVNAIETIDNIIFLPGLGCIYAYGNINPLLPKVMTRQFTFKGSNTSTLIQFNSISTPTLTYFYENDLGQLVKCTMPYGKDNNATGNGFSLDPGTIIFNPIISNIYSSKDGALKVRIGYDLPNTNTQINLYYKSDYNGGYANFYLRTWSVFPVVGNVYSYGWVTYTVYAISYIAGSNHGIIHCTSNNTDSVDIYQINELGKSLTKVSGTGDSTITYYRATKGMKLAGTITDITEHKKLFALESPCYQITFMVDLITGNSNYSPRLWDFVYAYQEIENDI